MTLLEQVADFENLVRAFRQCSKGKRRSYGYQKLLSNLGEMLLQIQADLHSGHYEWGKYREFWIHDPKRRLVSAAPFRDRLVHTAMHNIMEPYFDRKMVDGVYACRQGKGNRHAVVALLEKLKQYGAERFVLKLDVKSYFATIDHGVLFEKLTEGLPDESLNMLLKSLLSNHPVYAKAKAGIPIGNLTSQLCANIYLMTADEIAIQHLPEGFYFRYMDDLVLGARSKQAVLKAASAVITHVESELKLSIPFYKRVPLGNAPVPFLGFVLNQDGYRILRRNERRYQRKRRRLEKQGERLSRLAQVELSFNAWANLGGGESLILAG